MKRAIHTLLALLLLLSAASLSAHAVKVTQSRTIAIVFDNSGSMYQDGNQAWCRATYAMEVFASMLNAGDTLLIYPMHPIQIDGKQYTMYEPFRLRNAEEANQIRSIYTPKAGATPIESIDCAVEGLKAVGSGQKCLIVLTDGDSFYRGSANLYQAGTVKELNKRIQANAGPDMMFMYLGIGEKACMPTVEQTDYFQMTKAANTADVLAGLTEMCNNIFGRDTLPNTHIKGQQIDFDISMSKLIVFVQGENIDNLTVTNDKGKPAGTLVNIQKTGYSTMGAGAWTNKGKTEQPTPDTSLQGMMVTYADCPIGTYTLDFTGTDTSTAIYYEPDVDMSFTFTDEDGEDVDLNKLYAGTYKMAFGMKDAVTGEMVTESDLLGTPKYRGNYYINGEAIPFEDEGYSCEKSITLAKDDTFRANLTSTFLNGYTITKASTDFGWPEGGITVAPRKADRLTLQLVAPKDYIVIPQLKKQPEVLLRAKPLLKNTPLTDEQFAYADLKVECDSMEQTTWERQGEEYLIRLTPKKDIAEGKYPVRVTATYADPVCQLAESTATQTLTFNNNPLWQIWLFRFLLLFLIIALIVIILRIPVLPSKMRKNTDDCYMSVGGKPVTDGTNFVAALNGNSLKVNAEYSGEPVELKISDIKPAKDAFLCKPSRQRKIVIDPARVSPSIGEITYVSVGGVDFKLNPDGSFGPTEEGQLPFRLGNGATITLEGNLPSNGRTKRFHADVPLLF